MKIPALSFFILVEGVSAFVPKATWVTEKSWSKDYAASVVSLGRTATTTTTTTRFAANTDGTTTTTSLSRISSENLRELKENKYVVIPNFLSSTLQEDLRADVAQLREAGKFNIAKIGQDSTNSLNTQIRVAETCFLEPGRYPDVPSPAREDLFTILDQARQDLAKYFEQPLDKQLTELLYAYYPQGGFYRRHRDAIPGSASVLREYSLLLYINKDWREEHGGRLRMHFDGGGDTLPEGVDPNYVDVAPKGGTLVLFESDIIPHEVLDTQKERQAIIGWYNRKMTVSDVSEISGGGNPMQIAMLGVAAALVTIGVAQILS